MSWTKNNRLQCDICGKMMAYEDRYSWTYFGSCADLEPPDPNDAHIKCYEAQSERERELTARVSWIKPCIV